MEEEKERKERNEVDANIETNKYDESELQADNFDKYSTTKNHHAFKLHPIILFSFVILIAFNITIILTMKYKPELFNFSNGSLENYSSLDDLYKNSALAESIGLKIPSSLLSDKKEDFQIREVYGSMVEISNQETFVLKGSYYVDIHADPLGFYDVCEEDKEYIISEENKNDDLQYDAILYFRYRSGYPGYENCTIINWCTNTSSFGLLLGDKINEQEAINLISEIGLDMSILEELVEE